MNTPKSVTLPVTPSGNIPRNGACDVVHAHYGCQISDLIPIGDLELVCACCSAIMPLDRYSTCMHYRDRIDV